MIIAIEYLQLEELKAFLREQADDAFPDLKDEQRLDMLAGKWAQNAEFCICRNEGSSLVGMIVFYANRPEGEVVYLPHVYVNGEYRGKRVMTSMINYIKDYVKGKGYKYLKLEVNKNNERAQNAYLHFGFLYSEVSSVETIFMRAKI